MKKNLSYCYNAIKNYSKYAMDAKARYNKHINGITEDDAILARNYDTIYMASIKLLREYVRAYKNSGGKRDISMYENMI